MLEEFIFLQLSYSIEEKTKEVLKTLTIWLTKIIRKEESMKIKTIKINGDKDYAKVADRIKVFWEENPNGKIDTEREDISENKVRFIARIWRDSDVVSNLATTSTKLILLSLQPTLRLLQTRSKRVIKRTKNLRL